MFLEYSSNKSDIVIHEHHLIKEHKIYCLEKLNTSELYNMQLALKEEKPTAPRHIGKNIFKTMIWYGRIYIPYQGVKGLMQIFVYS